MKIISKIAFYCLFAFGAIRLFDGLSHFWALVYNSKHQLPDASNASSHRYYRFDSFEKVPMESSQVLLLVVTGLMMIGFAFFIRKKVDENGLNASQ